jgi:hypothetical protein
MTTQFKITRADLQDTTASASQNRAKRITPQSMLDELYAEHPEIAPAKPADAHAASAHTPMTGDTERLLQIGQLTRERDQAREQVKTLLSAHIWIRDVVKDWTNNGSDCAAWLSMVLDKARNAIASVERSKP